MQIKSGLLCYIRLLKYDLKVLNLFIQTNPTSYLLLFLVSTHDPLVSVGQCCQLVSSGRIRQDMFVHITMVLVSLELSVTSF